MTRILARVSSSRHRDVIHNKAASKVSQVSQVSKVDSVKSRQTWKTTNSLVAAAADNAAARAAVKAAAVRIVNCKLSSFLLGSTERSVLLFFSLRTLCVLCVSAVNSFYGCIHRRDAEDAEVAQRNVFT